MRHFSLALGYYRMEAYALLALGALGLYAARKQFSSHELPKVQGLSTVQGNVSSVNSVYDASRVENVAKEEQRMAKAMAALASLPLDKSSGQVISRSQNRVNGGDVESRSSVRSQLAGVDIPTEHFTHNNMMPFFKGDTTQNLDPLANATLLENMNGSEGLLRPPGSKREVPSLFNGGKESGNMNGTPVSADRWRDRMVLPTSRNNDFPIPQVKVGPGIDKGFTALPSDGYYDQRSHMYPRGTDEIRAANKPKLTYDGRVLPGQGAQNPGSTDKMGTFEKNRPDTFEERPMDWYQPTTGAYLKESQRPAIEDRPQAREGTTREYAGAAFSAHPKDAQRQQVQEPKTQSLHPLNVGPVAATDRGAGAGDDKGRASIQIYANARDVTTTKVYQGNVASLVKSMTAPLMDMLKPTRAACPHIVYNPREEGNMKGPSRIRVYDPDDVARATLKETMLNESEVVNLKGPQRPVVRDPSDITRTTLRQTMLQESDVLNLRGPNRATVHDTDDVAKTTMRQTMLQEAERLNLRGPARATVHDTDDVARTTMRQTMLQEAESLNLRGPSRTTVYDPADVMRTTLRQTMLQEADGLNLRGPARAVVYDPEDVTRTTIRETMIDQAQSANVASHLYTGQVYAKDGAPRTTIRETLETEADGGSIKPAVPNITVWDPNDIARTTTKETLIDAEREAGNPDGLERRRGGYMNAKYQAKQTQKEATSDSDYYGQGARDLGEGYATAPTDIKPTAKAILSDNEYFGGAADATGVQMSHENYDNAVINELRELILEGREPTTSSVKVAASTQEAGTVEVRKQLFSGDIDERRTLSCVNAYDDGEIGDVTHDRHLYTEAASRLDDQADGLKVQMHSNPYSLKAFSDNLQSLR